MGDSDPDDVTSADTGSDAVADPRPAPPRRRLRHRIPRSLRQHWKLPVALAAFVIVMATVFGGWKVSPLITGDPTVITSEITHNIAGTVDLFDPSVPHELTIEMSDAEYRSMLSSFEKDGSKEWVSARVVIDGTRLDDVAVRLKGNSTLMGLRGDRGGRPGGPGAPPGAPGGGAPQGPDAQVGPQPPFQTDPADMERMRKMMTQVDKNDPTSLPLLLSFDENVDGRAYQGMTELSVRPGSPVVNEATALTLTARTGQPSQRYAYVAYTINGSPTATKLVLEHPDESYAERLFDSKGYLYKADAGSRLKYVGEDQSDYSGQFKQINSADNGNLQPVIDLARWLDRASDEEFARDLHEWVDVESFARYVATQNLLGNGDDMSGPGRCDGQAGRRRTRGRTGSGAGGGTRAGGAEPGRAVPRRRRSAGRRTGRPFTRYAGRQEPPQGPLPRPGDETGRGVHRAVSLGVLGPLRQDLRGRPGRRGTRRDRRGAAGDRPDDRAGGLGVRRQPPGVDHTPVRRTRISARMSGALRRHLCSTTRLE
uniref:CotH kinase family protein n=1 Tax=Gordonia paraffinivorans TaxID=175628 RepID=UPI00289D693B|nr:CotH kinase family protein [Gordonia paraffinivorans]